jgi:hypothetical protein
MLWFPSKLNSNISPFLDGSGFWVSHIWIPKCIEIFYIRYPRIPNWTYSTITNSEPIFNQNDPAYQDFEVAETEYVKLALKILQYCGVQIREQEVVTYAAQQEQITHQTEKQ